MEHESGKTIILIRELAKVLIRAIFKNTKVQKYSYNYQFQGISIGEYMELAYTNSINPKTITITLPTLIK